MARVRVRQDGLVRTAQKGVLLAIMGCSVLLSVCVVLITLRVQVPVIL